MGKRSKEKRLAESAGRRKQTIQLEGFGRRQQAPSYDADDYNAGYSFSQGSSKVSGIQMLGAYQEGSDDDSGRDSPIMMNQNLSLPAAAQPERKIDDELAGFLAEINAIETTTSTNPDKPNEEKNDAVYDPLDFDPSSQAHLLPSPWQAVLDDGSGYHYYWNCETNEVQWEPPPAPAVMGCPLPEPPPPPMVVDVIRKDEDGNGSEAKGPSLAEIQASEEEEQRKAMSAKLAGLSKKERIKLLLQKNKINVEESNEVGEKTEQPLMREDENASDLRDSSKEEIAEKTSDRTLEVERPFEEEKSERKPSSGLVMDYDSDASESSGDNETVAEDEDALKVNGNASDEILGSNSNGDASVDTGAKPSLSKEALIDMAALFEETDKLTGFESTSDSSVHRSNADGSARQTGVESSVDLAANAEISTPPIDESVSAEGEESGNLEVESSEKGECKEFRSEDALSDEVMGTSQRSSDADGRDELLFDSDGNEQKGDSERCTSSENLEIERKVMEEPEGKGLEEDESMEAGIDENEMMKRKEFSVDIFAEESDHNHEEEVDVNSKDEEGTEIAPVDDEGGSRLISLEVEGEASSEDKKRKKQKDVGKEDRRRTRHGEKKKAKKEKKRHKDHDRKHSGKKHKIDKHEKKSKRHSEKYQESSKSSRKLQEEVEGREMGKKERETPEEGKAEDKVQKAVLEEVDNEDGCRDEYEMLKVKENDRKKEEEVITNLERMKQEEKRKEEEKLKDEEMDDFAEMLLEGALEGNASPVSDAEKIAETQAADDMEISDTEESDSRPPLPPMPPPDDDRPTIDRNWDEGNHDAKFYEEMQTRISDLSLLLFDKLEFLEVSKKGLTNFQVMFIELETRMSDWRAGALDSEYLMYKLEEIDAEICKYEETAAPEGWRCQWSSDYGMYYYYHEKTGNSTWSYPSAAETGSGLLVPAPAAYGSINPGVGSSKSPAAPASAPLDDYGYGRSNMMMWRSDLVENEEEAAPSQNVETKSDPYQDPYRRLLTTIEQPKEPAPAVETPLPPGEDEDSIQNPWEEGNRSGPSSPLHPSLRQPEQPASAAPVVALATSATLQSERTASYDEPMSHTVAKSASIIATIPRVASDSVLVTSHAFQTQSIVSAGPVVAQPKGEKKKKEKRKKVVSGGLPSKKLKKVSSLVQKWQQVKQKADEEMMEDSSGDEDPSVLSQKRIDEWKKAQLDSGRAARNPNFAEIKGDWREKIKKKQK